MFQLIFIKWDFAEKRYANPAFHVFPAMHPRIQKENQQTRHSRHRQTQQHPQQQNTVSLGRNRGITAVSTVNDPCIVVHHGLRQSIFLTTIKQKHIKRFLNFLLPFNREHLPFFRRNGCDSALRQLLPALCIVPFHVDAHNHVVHSPDNTLLHGMKRIVQFLHHRIAVTAFVYQLVPFELDGIILADLAFDIHITDTCIGRNQVCLFSGIRQIILDILCKLQLCFQFQGIRIVLLRFRDKHVGRGGYIHHLIIPLERFQVCLYITQFLSNDDQTFINELSGIHGHLIFVSNGFLIIYGYQHVQHVFGTNR